jgi:amidase
MAPQVSFYKGVDKESTASEIAAVNVRLRELKKEYLDYWTATEKDTGTGRPVDAVICPLAPFPAARRERFRYLGYSAFVNALDYTSVVVPVTNVDKSVDVVDDDYKPIDDSDAEVQGDCKSIGSFSRFSKMEVLTFVATDDPEVYDGAHVSLQLVGRRLQEEKMIAIAELVGKAVGR